MVEKRVGKRIKEQRKRLNLTQSELAYKLGVSENYISMLERGVKFPRYETLVALLNALDTSADSIFCDVVNRSSPYFETELSARFSKLKPGDKERAMEMIDVILKQIEQLK